jgi:thiosulfate/3-mercaptopyruvate sulfurtransferase
MLAETDWLAEHRNDPGLRIVDCDQYAVYRRAHIDGAIGILEHHYIKQPGYAEDARKHPLVMPPEPFAELMGQMAIGNDTTVIAYDSFGSLWAARFWWVLSYYGHENVKVLNGGWRKWFGEDRPLSVDVPTPTKASYEPRPNPDLLCTVDYGLECVDDDDTVILDVRSDGEWNGTADRGNRRAGHVPGAVHLEWLNFVTDDDYRTIKPASELRVLLEERGVTPDKQVITY